MSHAQMSHSLLILPLALMAWPTLCEAKVNLPAEAPIPVINAPAPGQPPTNEIPLPEPRPQHAPGTTAPVDKPSATEPPGAPPQGGEKPPEAVNADPRSPLRPDPSGVMPDSEINCRRDLQTLGVSFQERPALSDSMIGCSVPYPLMVRSLGAGVQLEPGAEMNCSVALAAARFTRDVISPKAKAEFGQDLTSIVQASAYVCRPRHGTTKISEHAFGNALDIATFKLSGGETINVEADAGEKGQKFLAAVRQAACGPFKTVLGPGSDADHALHLHLDLAPRRNGATFCQ